MTDFVDVVDIPAWIDKAGRNHGPQRLVVLADADGHAETGWLDIPPNLVALFDPAIRDFRVLARVWRGTSDDELREAHRRAQRATLPAPGLVDPAGRPITKTDQPSRERIWLQSDRVLVRVDGRRMAYHERAREAPVDAVPAERLIGALAADAAARLGGDLERERRRRQIYAAIDAWLLDPKHNGQSPKRDAIAAELDRARTEDRRALPEFVADCQPEGFPALVRLRRRVLEL
jgi:hypothetical protein